MKFALVVLLGLCAVAAHASIYEADFEFEPVEPRNKITDEIRAKISALVKKATEDFSAMTDKISEIMSKVRQQIRDAVLKAKERIDQAKEKIAEKIAEAKKKGGVFAECAKKFEPEYKQVEEETMSGLKKCAGEAFVKNEEHREHVSQTLAAIRANFREIRDMVSDCLGWNPIKTAKCIFEQTSELKKMLDGVATGCRELLGATRQRAQEIMTKTKQCNSAVLGKASEQVKELNNQFSACYESAQFF